MGFFDIFKKKQDSAAADIPESRQQQQEELSAGLEKTKTGIFSKLARAVAGRSTVDADLLDDVEEVLITSDVGVETTVKIIRRIEERVARDKYMNTSELQSILREEVMSLMEESHGSEKHFGLDARQGEPYVVMVVGVNGAGKTTTIGKLASRLKGEGKSVILGAADTFRAAAVEQLQSWADKLGIPIYKGAPNQDPASVCYEAHTQAIREGFQYLICDTAGRLHTRHNLMEELSKIRRTLAKQDAAAPHRTLLVVDATTGANALAQAREFHKATPLDSVIITKMDGSGKGGVAVAIMDEMHISPAFLGTGEGAEDFEPFNRDRYVDSLL